MTLHRWEVRIVSPDIMVSHSFVATWDDAEETFASLLRLADIDPEAGPEDPKSFEFFWGMGYEMAAGSYPEKFGFCFRRTDVPVIRSELN